MAVVVAAVEAVVVVAGTYLVGIGECNYYCCLVYFRVGLADGVPPKRGLDSVVAAVVASAELCLHEMHRHR